MVWSKRRNLGTLILIATVAITAACGSSGNTGSAAPLSSGASTSAGCPSSVRAELTKDEAPVALRIGPKLNVSSLRGKSIWVIGVDNEQAVIASIQSGVDAAAAAAGLKVTNFDAQGQTSKAVQGVSEAVANHAAGIIVDAINTKDISGPLSDAKAAGIPVISDYEPASQPGTIAAVVTDSATLTGRAQGAVALNETDCNTKSLFIDSPIFSAQIAAANATTQFYKEVCSSSCTTSTVNYDPATLATTVGTSVSNAVQRDPQINMVLAETDDVAIYAVPALEALSSNVKLAGGGGETANLKFIKDGTVQIADIATPSNEFTGWISADQLFRAMLKEPLSKYDVIPQRLVTKDNLGDGSITTLFPAYTNFESKFKTAWGLS